MALPRQSLYRMMAGTLWLAASAAVWPSAAGAQSPGALTPSDISPLGRINGLSSPVYAESAQGSPYSEVYARTFSPSGDPVEAPRAALPGTARHQGPAAGSGEVVYVIDSQGLLTFRAEDYGQGEDAAIARNPLPLSPGFATGPEAPAQVPTVADNLYLQPPLTTAAGAAADDPAGALKASPP